MLRCFAAVGVGAVLGVAVLAVAMFVVSECFDARHEYF